MATFSFGATPGAPGTYINETVGNIASAGISSFSTVYMLVEAEESVPVTVFPFNTPVAITSLQDYKALVGGVVPESRIPLLSYNCVNSFYQNAQVGDLRVVRVGTPNQISEIEFLPSGTKLNNSGLPTNFEAGDIVYAQLILNGLKLVAGDGSTGYSSSGEWLGVPVTIPVDYIAGDAVNNRKISKAVVTAIAAAIESNPSVSSSIYVRDFGLVVDLDPTSTSESGFITIAASSYGGSVSVVNQQNVVGSYSVIMNNSYDVQNIVGMSNNLERVYQDYIQCINTAFDGQQNQGYLITPTAYAQFDAAGRSAIGAAAAAHCQSNNYKWIALADPGPFFVTDLNKYKEFAPHKPAADLVTGLKYLVDNAIYEWTGVGVTYDKLRYQPIISGSDPKVAVQQSVEEVAADEKVGAIDNGVFTVTTTMASSIGQFQISSSDVWPAEFQIMEVTLEAAGADFTALGDVAYIVAPPFNQALYGPYPSNGSSQIVYITETAAEASAVYAEVVAAGGSDLMASLPMGAYSVGSPAGTTVLASYGSPAWDLMNQIDINGQESNLIQNISGSSQFVNTVHLPGTLQDSTKDFRLGFVSRTILDPNSDLYMEAYTLGSKQYWKFNCVSHTLQNGQKVFFTQPVTKDSQVLFKASSVNGLHPYYVKVLDEDSILLASSFSNYLAGNYVEFVSGTLSNNPTILYSSVTGGSLTATSMAEVSTFAMIRGRKYGLASGTIVEEATKSNNNATAGVGVSLYLNNSSVVVGKNQIFPYGETAEANWLPELSLVEAGSTTSAVENFICTPTVEQKFSTEAYIVPVIDPIYGGNYDPDGAGALSGTLSVYSNQLLDIGDTGADIQNLISKLEGVYFEIVDNDGKAPDGTTDVVQGDRIVVTFDGSNYNWTVIKAQALGGDLTSASKVCLGAQVEISLTSEQTPPSNLWRFDAITSTEIMDNALRGVGFNGEPQAEFVEAGVDNDNRLYEDSQRYFNAFGFIAFYGPYVLNASNQFIPPSPYVAGVALRRYRAEGFQFPPAGVKYQLADAVGTQIPINSAQQNLLNPDGCNAVRTLPGYPNTAVFIWGGRTRINKMDENQRKFQFVNTRVIQNVVYGSLRNAYDSQIFSIVDGFGLVYNQIVSIGNSVLSQLWRAGALFGARPSDAFQVICDDRINTPETLENGVVMVKVFDVPAPTLERMEVEQIRVSVGQMSKELNSQGLSNNTF